jgi:hypothetical protein
MSKIFLFKLSKFSFSNCQNFLFQSVKFFFFKLSKFSFSNVKVFLFKRQNFPLQTVKVFLFRLSKFSFSNCQTCLADLLLHFKHKNAPNPPSKSIKGPKKHPNLFPSEEKSIWGLFLFIVIFFLPHFFT